MSANPHTNGGLLLSDLRLPDFRDYAIKVSAPGAAIAEATRGSFERLTICSSRTFGPNIHWPMTLVSSQASNKRSAGMLKWRATRAVGSGPLMTIILPVDHPSLVLLVSALALRRPAETICQL